MSDSSVFSRRTPGTLHPEIVRGEGSYLYDRDGKKYLDAAGGAVVVSVGHGVPEIADAARRAARAPRLRARLRVHLACRRDPGARDGQARADGRRAAYLVSGGSEATETAIKLARTVQLARGAAGTLQGDLSLAVLSRRLAGRAGRLRSAPTARPVRAHADRLSPCARAVSPYRCTLRGCGDGLLRSPAPEALDALIRAEGPDSVSAFIAEPVVGASAGAVVRRPATTRRCARSATVTACSSSPTR